MRCETNVPKGRNMNNPVCSGAECGGNSEQAYFVRNKNEYAMCDVRQKSLPVGMIKKITFVKQ
jgi:hypothetical protein